MADPKTRWIVGCMSGTSLDAVDATLVQVRGQGLRMSATVADLISRPLGPLTETLAHLAAGHDAPPIAYMRAARALGELYADVVSALAQRHPHTKFDLIVAHGQTIWHAPHEGLSWQLFDPSPAVQRLRTPVVYDLRRADLAAGGQGAPITPLADWVLFRPTERDRLIVNLGGICNVTTLPSGKDIDAITGADIGPCNLLIDGVVRRLYQDRTMDRDGRIAAQGRVNPLLYEHVRAADFFNRPQPRTTGREDFSAAWLDELVRDSLAAHEPADIVASAVDAAARLIGDHVQQFRSEPEVVLAGGGAHNPVLVERVRDYCQPAPVIVSSNLGIAVEAREAACMAVLGALTQDGVRITLKQVTGCHEPALAGAWMYP